MLYTYIMNPFVVKQERFEGTLDLLLSLIEKRKLHINDITLAKVADDFLAYTRNLHDFPISETANFILIASTLVLIKSKSLLPGLALSVEEEENIKDLEKRLKIYEYMRNVARTIQSNFGKKIIFAPQNRKFDAVFSPDDSMTLAKLSLAIKDVLLNIPKKEILPKAIVEKIMSLEEMIDNLTERIKSNLKMSFKEFSGAHKKVAKVHIIVSFLAMLELVKQGILSVSQEKHFSDITMETERIDVPKYT